MQRQVLPIVGSWHVNLVLFCFDGGQVPQRCLISMFISLIKCFGLLPQVHAQQEQALFGYATVLETSIRNREAQGSSSSIKCFDLSPQVHNKVHALSGSNFFPLTEKASHILLPVSQSKPRAEQEPFAPNWSASSVLALVWPTPVLALVKSCWRGLPVNLHATTPFAQIGQGYLRRALCVGILLHLS